MAQGLGAGVLVAGGLWLLGADLAVALPLAGVAVASAPAAIAAVVDDLPDSGPFSQVLLGVAAVSDALAIVAFSLLLVATGAFTPAGQVGGAVGDAAWELAGGVVLGLVLDVPGALLSVRLQSGQPLLEEALGGLRGAALIGLALLAENRLPEAGPDVVAVVIGSTVLFELGGPLLTRTALQRAGAEAGR